MALELSQAWDYENLDYSGSCEDEETWVDSEMHLWTKGWGNVGEGGAKEDGQGSGWLTSG